MPINTYARILLHTHAFKLIKKRWITLSLLVLALTQSTTAQTLLIQSGLSASRFSNTPQHEFTTKPTIALGFEYLHKKYLDVSTNIGFISRYNAFNSIDYFSESYIRTVDGISSLTFNTIADIKIPIGHSAFFISAGPRVDYTLSRTPNYEKEALSRQGFYMPQVLYGGIVGVGFKVNTDRFVVGIRGSYYLDIDPLIEGITYQYQRISSSSSATQIVGSTRVEVRPQLFSFTIDLGFRLGKSK